MILPKRFAIFPPDWGMLRRSRCVHFFSNNNNTNYSSSTILTTVVLSVDFLLLRLNAYPVSFMSLTLCLIAKLSVQLKGTFSS